jgi:hypothetical protein
MGQRYWGPDGDKVAMARLLHKLDVEHAYSLDPDMKRRVDSVLTSHAAATSEIKRQHDAVAARAKLVQDVLDTDVDISGTKVNCEAETNAGWRRSCSHYAKVARTWTTNEHIGLSLDGVVLERENGHYVVSAEWEIGKGFTKRPITDEEYERAVSVYKTHEHHANLCGTHRIQKGSYGLPY